MGISNLWNLQALDGLDYKPQPKDLLVNHHPEDIDITIDGGSGKWKIAFWQRSGNSYEPFFKDEIEGDIAKGTYNGHRTLSEDGMAKVLEGLPRFRRHIVASGSQRVLGYTTGAIRYATEETPDVCANFISEAEKILGFSLTNISGVREAQFQLMGAKALHPDLDAMVGGMGGSTFEGGIIHAGDGFSDAAETGLGSHTAYAEHKATKLAFDTIVRRELGQLNPLMKAASERGLPFIAAGSIFRRVSRLLYRQLEPFTPLYMNFVSGRELPRDQVLMLLAEWGQMSGKQIERQLRPPLDETEQEVWDKKISSYRDRLPIAADAMFEIMTHSKATALIPSSLSTRAGVVYADRHGFDLSDILSRPVSPEQPASPAHSAPAHPASARAPDGRKAPAASQKEPAL